MRSISDELAFIGSPVSTDDLTLYILGGLGSDFNALVTTVSARQGPTSLAELQSLLYTHENLLQSQHSTSSSSSLDSPLHSSAYFTQTRGSRPGYSSHRGFSMRSGSRSGYNPRPGSRPPHSSNPPILPTPSSRPPLVYSQASPSQSNRAYNPDRATFCQLCSKKGHSAKIYWYIGDFVPPSSAQSQHPSAQQSPTNFQSHLAQTAQPQPQPNAQAFLFIRLSKGMMVLNGIWTRVSRIT